MKNTDIKTSTRRQFLKKTVALPIGLTILPSSILWANSPANKITMGFIGVGGMGTQNLQGFLNLSRVKVLAVCDVDKSHRDNAKHIVDQFYANNDCASYNDFREITRRDDIDAVCISTPDHWHTIPAIDAMVHGKDAFVEKPLTLTIREGRLICNAAEKYSRIVQIDSWQRSVHNFRFACELVRNGYIGELQNVEVAIPGNNRECGPTWTPQPVPEGFDYDFWLGPAPWKPYHEQRCHYQFRFISDYSGGQTTNWGSHYIDIAQWGMGTDHTGPIEIIGRGEFSATGLFDTATIVDFECVYANGVHLTCQTGKQGTKFVGSNGRVFVNREELITEPVGLVRQIIPPACIQLERSHDHRENFIDSVITRKQPIANAEIGHRSATICHLGNIAMQLKHKLQWDPQNEVFIENELANRMVSKFNRAPWKSLV